MPINKVPMENSHAHSFLCLQLLLCNQAELGDCKTAWMTHNAENIYFPDSVENTCKLRIKPKVLCSDVTSGILHDGNRRKN